MAQPPPAPHIITLPNTHPLQKNWKIGLYAYGHVCRLTEVGSMYDVMNVMSGTQDGTGQIRKTR